MGYCIELQTLLKIIHPLVCLYVEQVAMVLGLIYTQVHCPWIKHQGMWARPGCNNEKKMK